MMGHADDTNELEIGGLTSRSICNNAYTCVSHEPQSRNEWAWESQNKYEKSFGIRINYLWKQKAAAEVVCVCPLFVSHVWSTIRRCWWSKNRKTQNKDGKQRRNKNIQLQWMCEMNERWQSHSSFTSHTNTAPHQLANAVIQTRWFLRKRVN